METKYLENKIKIIQKQLNLVRYLMSKESKKKKAVRLEGTLKGISVSEEDIRKVKRALFK